jgi:hypothetical protein
MVQGDSHGKAGDENACRTAQRFEELIASIQPIRQITEDPGQRDVTVVPFLQTHADFKYLPAAEESEALVVHPRAG